jgi:tRNA modification GTPase
MAATDDTIVALSSGRPPAAIAVIRISGPRAVAAATAICGPLPAARQAALRSLRDPTDDEPIDEALALHFPGPHSATGEDIVEFQCHGGRAIVDCLLQALTEQQGVRLAEPGEFTRRALANNRIDLTEAEGLADLLAAETELQRKVALRRAGGALRAKLEAWRSHLVALSADAEVAIDYPDEEDGVMTPDLHPDAERLLADIRDLLAGPRTEKIRDGVRVVLAGPPNAGKSSLLNALVLSERAIVTPIPGTTRDTIEVAVAIDGIPFLLIDTAGLRVAGDEIEALGVERTKSELESADIVLWLGPPADSPQGDRIVLLSPKADLDDGGGPGLRISNVTGQGVEDLRRLLAERGRAIVPSGEQISLTLREAGLIERMAGMLEDMRQESAPEVQAELLRQARAALDQVTGRVAVEDVLDELFGRYCLGK